MKRPDIETLETPNQAEDIECTCCDVDGTRCGLTTPHKLHEFTIAPPDEYFEDDDEENDFAGEVQFDNYADEAEAQP